MLTHLEQILKIIKNKNKQKKPARHILARLGWKNAVLLKVRRSNGHLINLSPLQSAHNNFAVTLFNSLMTSLSVRLRGIESIYDLIKRVHMFKTVPVQTHKHWGSRK